MYFWEKKIMKCFSVLLLGFLICTSCSHDDGDSNIWDEKILGSWTFDRYEVNTEGEITNAKYYEKKILDFRENGLVVGRAYGHMNSSTYGIWASDYRIENDSLFCMWTSDTGGVKIKSITAEELVYTTGWEPNKKSILTVFLKRSKDEK